MCTQESKKAKDAAAIAAYAEAEAALKQAKEDAKKAARREKDASAPEQNLCD